MLQGIVPLWILTFVAACTLVHSSLPPNGGQGGGAQEGGRSRSEARAYRLALPAALRQRATRLRAAGSRRTRSAQPIASTQWVVYCAYDGSDCNVVSPSGALVSALGPSSGLNNPQGTAVGRLSGNWYVANSGAQNVQFYTIDYAAEPILTATLSEVGQRSAPGQYPVDVAVYEPGVKGGLLTSPRLAVSNIFNTNGLSPSVLVCTLAVTPSTNPCTATRTLTDKSVQSGEGIGIAFDQQGNCYWSVNQSPSGTGYIDEFAKCGGRATRLSGVSLGYAGGLAFDGGNNLWYVDQLGEGPSKPAGVYECSGTSNCTLFSSIFSDPVLINFDLLYTNLYVTDAASGNVYACAVVSGPSCGVFYAPGAGDPPYGVAVDSSISVVPQDSQRAGPRAVRSLPQAPTPTPTPTLCPSPCSDSLTPQNFWQRYSLGANGPTGGAGKTVAIVEPFHDPTVQSDVAAYRKQYTLGGDANGNVTVVNEAGAASPLPATPPPGTDTHASEVAEMVAANCPNCKILVVELANDKANSAEAGFTAASKAADVVNMSFGTPEVVPTGVAKHEPLKTTKPTTASAGNDSYQMCRSDSNATPKPYPCYPATSPSVIAVGGTWLTCATRNESGNCTNWNEQVWLETGSGCSEVFPQSGWQKPVDAKCAMRVANDVSFSEVANAVYETRIGQTTGGWNAPTGTSFAAPAIAALIAAAGGTETNAASLYHAGEKNQAMYFNKISKGLNGTCDNYLCSAFDSLTNGYNGPAGWGTPNGLGAFTYKKN